MPIDWADIVARYGKGAKVPTVTGGKYLDVAGADETAIYIQSPIWSATLDRSNLEKGVTLIEEGVISRDPGLFVEDYMLYVANQRATSVAHILRDLGFLDKTETFSIRC